MMAFLKLFFGISSSGIFLFPSMFWKLGLWKVIWFLQRGKCQKVVRSRKYGGCRISRMLFLDKAAAQDGTFASKHWHNKWIKRERYNLVSLRDSVQGQYVPSDFSLHVLSPLPWKQYRFFFIRPTPYDREHAVMSMNMFILLMKLKKIFRSTISI